ncbi:MAG: MFS transporter [Eggerthellaceae bacterium]|nr:MFS transporter [Eggerthellaceae bacterium]
MGFRKAHNIEVFDQAFVRTKTKRENGDIGLVLLTSLCHLLNDICTGVLPGMVPFLVSEYSYSYAMASLLMLTSHLLSAISQPLFGYLGDKHPRPWFMALGVFLSCCGACFMGFSNNFGYLIFCSMFIGFGSSIFHPEGGRLANLASSVHKGKCLSYFSVGGNMGYSLGPIVLSFSFMIFGASGTLLFAPIGIIAVVLVMINKKNLSILEADADKHNQETHSKNDMLGFALSLAAVTTRFCIHNAMLLLIPLFLMNNLGMSDNFSSVMLSCFGFCALIATLFGGFVAEKVGYKLMLLLSFVLYIPFILFFTNSGNVPMAVVSMVFIAFSGNISWSSGTAYAQQFLPRNLGMASGFVLGLSVSIGGASSALFGAIADYIGISLTLYCIVCFAVFGIMLTLFITRKNRFE